MHSTIIGGGIIGLSAAYYLQQEGWDVTVLERGDLTEGCSFGNMGYLSPSHFAPLAQPGVLSQGLWWLFNAKSPFYVRPALSWRLFDWGVKFARACNEGHVRRSAKPMSELLLLSRDLTAAWEQGGEMSFEYAQTGCVNYFKTPKYEKSELEGIKVGRDLGLDIEVLSREQCQALEPDMPPDVRGATWYKDDAILFPNQLMRQLPLLLEKKGARILRGAEVTGFQKQQGKITELRYKTGGEMRSERPDMVVLAAGSWSQPLAKLAGEYLPMMPGKGYSMTVDVAEQKLKRPCILLEAKVAISPWAERLRIGSTMEIGEVNDRILFPRVQGILEAVPRYFPGYAEDPAYKTLADTEALKKQAKEKVWFGFRPLSTDGLPYIGFARNTQNLLVATGHAMLGLSFAAGTGKVVAELASGKPTSVPVEAFTPGRV
jgi:D-amino-acid dehydrogenase